MVVCPFCEADAAHKAMDKEKAERLQHDTPSLEEKNLVRVVCDNCSHVWYADEDTVNNDL